MSEQTNLPEPWLRGTLTETPAIPRAVLHAMQAAVEDLTKWCSLLTDEEIQKRPSGLTSIAFHLRHIPGSIDRLLTYAEGGELNDEQLRYLKAEASSDSTTREALQSFSAAMQAVGLRVQQFQAAEFEQPRYVGRKRMPTTVGGLLVHVADHTQRHVGLAIATAKLLLANRMAQQETQF